MQYKSIARSLHHNLSLGSCIASHQLRSDLLRSHQCILTANQEWLTTDSTAEMGGSYLRNGSYAIVTRL